VRVADGRGGNWTKVIGIADDHEDADGCVFDGELVVLDSAGRARSSTSCCSGVAV
jgi:ATP-dependent DNA ligase